MTWIRTAARHDFRAAFAYASPAMVKLLQEGASPKRAGNPPLWIHVSQAGKWLLSPREVRKPALIRLLDEMKAGLPIRKKA